MRVEVSVVEVRSTEHQKPPKAGSTASLMYLSKRKESFHHKECNFTRVGVDRTSRRPLAVLLAKIASMDKYRQKTQGDFYCTKLRRARRYAVMYSRNGSVPRLLRVTRSHGGYPRLKASARSRRCADLPLLGKRNLPSVDYFRGTVRLPNWVCTAVPKNGSAVF